MKKLSLVVLMSMVMAACTANVYNKQGNAQVVTSKAIGQTKEGKEVVELLVRKDNGEEVVMTREYDAHVTVGSRIHVSEKYDHQDPDLISIRRYEFK
ncbi:deoxyribose-phosphate aldolase [Pasteurellaceae bacterium RH1A]|nr:deoxyribose-phosphate aldolase [Pasteurellaceae bacterium RH1A]